jgi:hypothetical protein
MSESKSEIGNGHSISYDHVITKTVKKTVQLELLPCPFCGGRAEFRIGGNYNPKLGRRMGVGVRCSECKATTPTRESCDAHVRAAYLWNTRTSS